MKYHLIIMGCQMNTADAQEMARPFEARGLSATENLQEAEVVIMNSCTVRQHADDKAISNLGRLRVWKDANPNRIVIFAGCGATLWGEKLKKKFPFVDLVSPATRIDEFPQAVDEVLRDRWNWKKEQKLFEEETVSPSARLPVGPSRREVVPESKYIFGSSATAYVTIMRGCNYKCTYCIVPTVRGREVYRPIDEILEEIRLRVSEGLTEVMLLGQTVNSYYSRTASVFDFSDLLRAVNAIEGVDRIRFMSPHPKHMRDPMLQAIADCKKVSRHVHLPLQSGSDRLLEKMQRFYTHEEYVGIVAKLRVLMPTIRLTTDIIVGFPGETQNDVNETLRLMDEVRFDGIFAFKYSPRPGTPAAAMADVLSEEEKENRLQTILTHHDALVERKVSPTH